MSQRNTIISLVQSTVRLLISVSGQHKTQIVKRQSHLANTVIIMSAPPREIDTSRWRLLAVWYLPTAPKEELVKRTGHKTTESYSLSMLGKWKQVRTEPGVLHL